MKNKSTDNTCAACPHPGCCCHFSASVKGREVITDHPCPYLSPAGRCLIYAERQHNPDCLSIEEMIKFGTIPKWCLHVRDDAAYQARTDTRLYDFKIVEDD